MPIGVQGVLSLQKQDGDVGGFQCVPYLFEHFEEWVKTQPGDRDPMHPDMSGLDVVNIDMEPGDLMIFNSLLAHGVRRTTPTVGCGWRNTSPCIRRNGTTRQNWQERIRLWRERDHPRRDAFPGDPREWEKCNAATAALTSVKSCLVCRVGRLGDPFPGSIGWERRYLPDAKVVCLPRPCRYTTSTDRPQDTRSRGYRLRQHARRSPSTL
jgi:hypothetical protein